MACPSGSSRVGIPANRCVGIGVTFTEAAVAGMALCFCSVAYWLSEGTSSRISSEVRLGEEIG